MAASVTPHEAGREREGGEGRTAVLLDQIAKD